MKPSLTMQEELIVAALSKDPGLSDARLAKQTKIPKKEVEILVKRPAVQRALIDVREKISGESLITTKRLIEEELHIAMCDPIELFDKEGKVLPMHSIPERMRRAISGIDVDVDKFGTVKYKIRLWDKGKALERLEKHTGFYDLDNTSKRAQIIFIRADQAKDYIDVTPEEEKKEVKKIEAKPLAIMD